MKRIIALILALVMTMALVACGGDKPTSSTPSTSTPAASTPATSTPATPGTTEPSKPAEPTLTKAEQLKKDNADKYGGEMVIVQSGVSPTMDIHDVLADSSYVNRPMNHIYENTIVLDANGKIYPQICDYTTSADGCTITLTMRERYFSNGEKITVDDVVASLQRVVALNLTSKTSFEKYWKGTTYKVEGDSIIFTTETYNINFLNWLASPVGTQKIMPKAICEKYAPDLTTGTYDPASGLTYGCASNQIDDVKDIIGSGPYCVESWEGDTELVFVRNENYQIIADESNEDAIGLAAPRMAYADKLILKINTDSSSNTAATLAGEYDVGSVQSAMWDTALGMGLKRWDAGTSWTHGIFFNLHESNADSPIADVNVRKAIRAVIDPAAVLTAVAGIIDRVVLEPYPVTKGVSAYQSDLMEKNEYNLKSVDKAKEYLAKSGYNGEPIVYLTHASGNFYKAAMAVIPMMESAGMKVELLSVDNGSHTAMRKDPKTGHDIGCWETQKREDNPVLQSTFVTGSEGWWTSPAKAAAVETMKSTPTGSAESVKAYNDFLQAVADEVPYILFGHLVGYTWTQSDIAYDSVGQNTYYWNHSFVK